MYKTVVTMLVSTALLAVGSVASSAHQTSAGAHQKRIAHHQPVTHTRGDITSFSSSSELHVGVNHPPKNR
jgi:hypothetical protein